jgi:hypothetical protein
MFTEDALGHTVNFFMFLMFFMYQFSYSGTMVFPQLKQRRGKIIWENKKKWGCWGLFKIRVAYILYIFKNFFGSIPSEKLIIDNEHLEEELKNTGAFILYSIAVLLFTAFMIIIDFCLIFNKDNHQFYAQLLVSTLTCVSMMFLFGQLNNGKLRLPGMAVVVMFFYAAVQLFSPFRDIEIMQSVGLLKTETFDFIVTTLCFIAKFMVFFIIRWMFTDGRFAYCSLDRAIHNHPVKIITGKERDTGLYSAIFQKEKG